MLVDKIMSTNLFLTHPDSSVTDAQALMRREHIHHLPVVDRNSKKLVGIVTEKDLLYASPSPASTLDVYEMANLLGKLKISAVMKKKVICVHPKDLVEDAARLMVDNNISGVPVMDDDGYSVGIITESDIFKLFIDLFGTRESGVRATIRIPEEPGELAKLGTDITQKGGNIVSIGTWPGSNPTNAVAILKVSGMTKDSFVESVERHIIEVIDIREV